MVMTLVESVFTVSDLTVVESVVVVVEDDPDPQAANVLIANTVSNFFM